MKEVVDRLEAGLQHWNLPLDPVQRDRFLRFGELLLEWNERMNLTHITDPKGIAVEHFLDSVAPLAFGLIQSEQWVVDVGTGGGFPGVPLAILCRDIMVTLVEATRKKVTFLQAVQEALGLRNVEVVWGRAEDLARKVPYRERVDVALARAFGPLDVVWECTLPFVRLGGIAIAYKGPKVDQELSVGERVASLLGGRHEAVHRFVLPTSEVQRVLVVARKESSTPLRFPRRPGLPQKHPLGSIIR